MSDDAMDYLLRALLKEVSPGEALLLDGKPLTMNPAWSPPRTMGDTAINFGIIETAVWLSPALIAIGKWLLETAQEPFRKKLRAFLDDLLERKHKEPAAEIKPILLDELSDHFSALCVSAGVSSAEAVRLKGIFVLACIDNADLLKRAIALELYYSRRRRELKRLCFLDASLS
jgi:hypothetical protein